MCAQLVAGAAVLMRRAIFDRYTDGKIQIYPMITRRLPLERIKEAFDPMHAGEMN